MKHRLFTTGILISLLALSAGCYQSTNIDPPESNTGLSASMHEKDGTETLGTPSIAIGAGSGFVEGGVGMVGVASAPLTVDVPVGSQVVQALLYWAGGTTAAAGDDEISLDGTLIRGDLIGGPTLFYGAYRFAAYRADITGLGLVQPGSNTFTVADFDFMFAHEDENSGVSLLVIYDDGTTAALELRDGLDMAFFGFSPTLDSTVPQTFAVPVADQDRTADLVIVAASVGENRPNLIRVATSAGAQLFDNSLGSFDGLQWDSIVLTVNLPAGVDAVSVELVSTASREPLGASMGWLVAGLSLPIATVVEDFEISGSVFGDADRDGAFADYETGLPDVVVELHGGQGPVATATTDADGRYSFLAPAGAYTVIIDVTDYPDAFNADLEMLFDSTTPVSLGVGLGPDVSDVDFGFVPRPARILEDLESGDLVSEGLTARRWRKMLRRALVEERSRHHGNGGGNGHDSGRHRHRRGCGHSEDFFSSEELLVLLNQVQGFYLIDPYQFAPGRELREAYRIVSSHSQDPEDQLLRELLVTELNYAAGLGLSGQTDVLGALIAWGESLLNFTETGAKAAGSGADKGRTVDLLDAVRVFGVINTGGGGSVDE